jgi:hypothetical protein
MDAVARKVNKEALKRSKKQKEKAQGRIVLKETEEKK